ncbi:MAG: hypothetical protein FJX76_16925 [Armatimonadetes bacterium]|nr:hypothetical protein [Armatimonadota bacterium]
MAAGSQGALLSSPDGLTWTACTSPTVEILRSVAFNGSEFAAVGDAGTIVISYDGTLWAVEETAEAEELWTVVFGNGRYVAGGARGRAYSSVDAVHWMALNVPSTENFYASAYGLGQFLLAGSQGAMLISSDGISFELVNSGTDQNLYGAAYTGEKFLAGGLEGVLIVSDDGRNWTPRATPGFHSLRGFAYAHGVWIAAGAGDLWTSPDTFTWTENPIGIGHFQTGITEKNGRLVVPGHAGRVLTSTDAFNWQVASADTLQNTNSAFSAGYFVLGSKGLFSVSADGLSWTAIPAGTPRTVRGLTYGNGQFVGVGGGPTVVTSPNGLYWTARALP